MLRFPTQDLPDRSAQIIIEEEVVELHGGETTFQYKDSKDALMGCYAPLAYSPHIVKPWFALAKAIYNKKTIQPRPRELAILAVSSLFDAPYVLYCHTSLGTKVGLSSEQIQMASQGQLPPDLTEIETATYNLALQLANSRGPLDSESWEKAHQILGKEGAVGVAHVVSGYLYVCTLLNIGGPATELERTGA